MLPAGNPLLYLAYVMVGMFVILLAAIILNVVQSNKALKLYADHIKATMNLKEVQKFINTHRKPKIEVGEDKTGKYVLVRWYVRERNRERPSVLVHVDKETKKPVKTQVFPETKK
jgi:hypothetical protein